MVTALILPDTEGVTVTVVDAELVPPGPVQVIPKPKLLTLVLAPILNTLDPLGESVPAQLEFPEQELALVLDQERVTGPPAAFTVDGEAVNVTVGATFGPAT